MTLELVHDKWADHILGARSRNPGDLLIVCPFIKQQTIKQILDGFVSKDVRVITRFNKLDFYRGVSDIEALRFLLDQGAIVRGIKGLHSKVYVFGGREVIVTSANLTRSALYHNYEFGFKSAQDVLVKESIKYFQHLWKSSTSELNTDMLDRWSCEIGNQHAKTGDEKMFEVEDEGSDLRGESEVKIPDLYTDVPAAYVKFFGSSSNRVERTEKTIDVVDSSGSYFACTYPSSRRPTSVPDGALIFLSHLVKNPNDILIYGRSIGMRHVPSRDEASSEDLKRRPWKTNYSNYIRIHDCEFVDGDLSNGVSLYKLMDDLGHKSFESTLTSYKNGQTNIQPRKSIRRPDAQLTQMAANELNRRLQNAMDKNGCIPTELISQLPKPSVTSD